MLDLPASPVTCWLSWWSWKRNHGTLLERPPHAYPQELLWMAETIMPARDRLESIEEIPHQGLCHWATQMPSHAPTGKLAPKRPFTPMLAILLQPKVEPTLPKIYVTRSGQWHVLLPQPLSHATNLHHDQHKNWSTPTRCYTTSKEHTIWNVTYSNYLTIFFWTVSANFLVHFIYFFELLNI